MMWHFYYKIFERNNPTVGMLKNMTQAGMNFTDALNKFYSTVKKDLDDGVYDFKLTNYEKEE